MRDTLAESLLARVMGWDPAAVANERPVLQALADYKYDAYEQYVPGMRFIESLARWLTQFAAGEQRQTAYDFVREKLIYISREEMQHLVASVYPDLIQPRLLVRAAHDEGIAPYLVKQIKGRHAFTARQRGTLYVGLSDGARTDVLRRSSPVISNEQVVADYQSLKTKSEGLVKDLREELGVRLGAEHAAAAKFSTLVFLDDFSASGISYCRDENGEQKGKVAKVVKELSAIGALVDPSDLEIHLVLYLATDQAMRHLNAEIPRLKQAVPGQWHLHRLQALGDEITIKRGDDAGLDELIDQTYDDEINTSHMAKGGTDGRYGFADCGLPLVLHHNTPNNSVAMIWAETAKAVALFPRVSRHRDD